MLLPPPVLVEVAAVEESHVRRARRVTGIAPSIGTVGDALDNALMESTIGLYKSELIEHERARSWSGQAEVERETASWVHWYNAKRIHHSIGKMSPIEFEEQYRLTNPARADEVA